MIHIRRSKYEYTNKHIYTKMGVPRCIRQVPMEFVTSDPERWHLYRCRAVGCHLVRSLKGGALHCRDWPWEDPRQDLRSFGVIRRVSPEWKAYYADGQAIEWVLKSLKEAGQLERYCVRGLR